MPQAVKDIVKQYILDAGCKKNECIPIKAISARHKDWGSITADDLNDAIGELVKGGEIELTDNRGIRRLT